MDNTVNTACTSGLSQRPEHLFHGSRAGFPLSELWLSEQVQEKNGVEGRFAFATHRIDQAILYAVPRPCVAGSGMGTLSMDENDTMGMFDARASETVRAQVFKNYVHKVPSLDFEQVDNNRREWVSMHPVAGMSVVLEVTSIRDAMEAGVQYFTLAPGASVADFERASRESNRSALAQAIAGYPQVMVWENEYDGISMDDRLAVQVAQLRMKASVVPPLASISSKLAIRRAAFGVDKLQASDSSCRLWRR